MLRYFCGRNNISDTNYTAKSSDARKTTAYVTWLSSYCVYVPSPVSPPLSHLCCLLRVHHWKGFVSSILLHWKRSCFLILYLYLSASSKRSCFFSLYCMNRVLFVKYPHFIEKGLASQFCTSLKRSSFSSMHNWKGLGF